MVDEGVEPSDNLAKDSKFERVTPLSPEKSKQVQEALSCFDRVRDRARSLGFMDQQFVDRLRSGLHSIEGDVQNSSPREVGYREAGQLASELSGFLRLKLLKMKDAADSVGLGTDPERDELEAMLKSVATETDPIKAFSQVSKVGERFSRFSDGLTQKREEQRVNAKTIGSATQENQMRANSIYQRVSEQLRMRLDGGVLDRYRLNSSRLLRTAEEAFQSLTAAERRVLEETGQDKIMFHKILESLTSQTPHNAQTAI